jgi:hypothetical protein
MRRREPDAQESRPKAPLWLTQTLPSLVEYRRRFGPSNQTIPSGFAMWRAQERDRWCEENGCLRGGKSCEEVRMRPCAGMQRRRQPASGDAE